MPYKIPVAVYLILRQNHKILLLLRKNTGYEDGRYGVVAGHLEKNETVTQAMMREAYEEANIIIHPQDLKVKCVMHRKSSDREMIDYFFECFKWKGTITNKEPEKCAALKFFDVKQLPNNIIPYIKTGIDNIAAKIFFTEFGW